MSANPEKRDLVFTRVFDAPVEDVWKLWTEPKFVMRWWGPDRFTCPSAKMDFREGGTAHVSMQSKEWGESFSIWQYRKIVPLERIEFIHNLADKDGNKVDPKSVGMPPDFPQDLPYVVAFKRLGKDKTEMSVTEYGWTVGQMMTLAKMGMEQSIEKMVKALAGP
ncbi:MAG: Activator of Hsp90 ATPase 1 family protein [Fibrobacteres bacterium]|nr:Activator of Hsp90 ATPase 1 family protein [Fibrobacterota bacterium]